MDRWHVTPNTVVAVRTEHCGMSIHTHGDPAQATAASLFLLASVTKTFVAAAVVSLADQQKLGLDDSVGRWLPSVGPLYDEVSLRMLLNHTSGLFDYFDDPGFLDSLRGDPQRSWRPEELIEIALSQVAPASVDRMTDDSVPGVAGPRDLELSYGLGTCRTLLEDTHCGFGVGHSGRWTGTSVDAYQFEDCNAAVAVMQNAQLHPPSAGAQLVLAEVVGTLSP